MDRYCLPLRTLLAILWITVTIAGTARAQTAPTPADIEEEKLERDFTDPLSTLPQVVIRDSYTPTNLDTDLQTNQLIIRPLIP